MIDKPLRKEEGMHSSLSREQIDEIFDVEELNPGIAGVGLCHSAKSIQANVRTAVFWKVKTRTRRANITW